MANKTSDLASDTAAELRATLGKLIRRLREEAPPGDFTWSQQKVLHRLERDGPATVTALALAEGVRTQSMGATVAVLKKSGVVVGRLDPRDGRQTVLSLTDRYRKTVETGRVAKQDWLVRALDTRLSRDEQKDVAAAVRLLARLVEP